MSVPTKKAICPSCGGAGEVDRYDLKALRAERKSRKISQRALAKEAGWQPTMVCEIESGHRPMTKASAERYWTALLAVDARQKAAAAAKKGAKSERAEGTS